MVNNKAKVKYFYQLRYLALIDNRLAPVPVNHNHVLTYLTAIGLFFFFFLPGVRCQAKALFLLILHNKLWANIFQTMSSIIMNKLMVCCVILTSSWLASSQELECTVKTFTQETAPQRLSDVRYFCEISIMNKHPVRAQSPSNYDVPQH